jgi:type I restriction enzyme, S subunit
LKGQEITVLSSSNWREDNTHLRLDSEFQKKVYLEAIDIVRRNAAIQIEDMGGDVLNGRPVNYCSDGDVPIIRSGDFVDIEDDDRFLRAHSSEPITYVNSGDVLISSIGYGSIGKIQVFDKPSRAITESW